MKKILKLAFVGVIGASLMLAGCSKDFTSDIQNLDSKIAALDQKVTSLENDIKAGSVIKDVKTTTDGIIIELSNGKSYNITNGKDGANGTNGKDGQNGADGKDGQNGQDGKPGSVITIGENGNWFIDGVDTGKPSQGAQGPQGPQGEQGIQGIQGEIGPQGPTGAAGNYWKPNTEKNVWEEYNGATNEKTGKTDGTVFPAGTLTAVWDKANGILEIANVKGADDVVKIDLNSQISSLVFVPALYFEGIEAMKYYYLEADQLTETIAAAPAEDDDHSVATWTKKSYNATTAKLYYGSVSDANYFVCPENYNVDKAEWGFDCLDRDVVTRGSAKPFKAKFQSISQPDNNGESVVKYTIENPENLTSSEKGKPVSVVSLTAKEGNNVVNSDWAAIAPFKEGLKAIAFNTPAYKANLENCAKNSHLFSTIKEAVESKASVSVQYNSGKFSLDIFEIHALDADNTKLHTMGETEKVYSVKDFIAKYPGSQIKIEEVPYKLGNNATEENVFGKVEYANGNWTFQPCYAGIDGKAVPCPEGKEEGISAVGRKPIYCVTLVGSDNKVVLAGYFKIQIKKEVKPIETWVKSFQLKNFGTIPYICDIQNKATKWLDMSYDILEKELGIDYEEFHATYSWVADQTYYLKSGKTGTSNDDFAASDLYGTVNFEKDYGVGAVNDKFQLSVSKDQAEQIGNGKDKVLYAHFKDENGTKDVYIGFKVAIADPAKAVFAEKNPSYWFNDIDGEKNTVRINVKVPNHWMTGDDNNDDVKNYTKDLRDNYVGNIVTVKLDPMAANYDVYNTLGDLGFKYNFKFNSKQPKINGNTLTVKADGTEIWVGTTQIMKLASKEDNGPICEITYLCNDKSKELLNLWSHTETDKAKMLYCDIDLVATYGECKIPCGTTTFHARFLRPVTIISNEMANLKDGVPTGDRVEIGKIFKAVDWQNYEIFKATETGYEPCYYPNDVNPEINWYGYYGFKTLKIDVANILTDQTGKKAKIKEINPAAEIWVSKIEDVMTKIEPALVDISNINNLKGYVFNYFNNMGVVNDFKLYVPFEIEYAWGTVKGEVEIPVEKTY